MSSFNDGCLTKTHTLEVEMVTISFETLFTIPEFILLPLEAANPDEHLPTTTQNGNLKWVASPENPTARCGTEECLVLDIDEIDPLYLGWEIR